MSIQLKVNSVSGSEVGNVDVSDVNFGVDFNEALIHQVVVAYQAGGRSGTRAQKNRSEVSGGGAKPWRQKGTGRARAGTIRSPIFRGGGQTFASSTQNFEQKVNKKMYRAAIRSILSELNRQERLIVVDGFALDAPKTRDLLGQLDGLGAPEALVVLSGSDHNVELSARNLKYVSVCSNSEINPVNLISHEKVIMTADAAKKIDEALR
ncbi:MAG: 50S ribosomal protein L4 [Gammaproteobacteria bacterium]|nr:50S ribosomal protein L4 [Gammaproteobacteria bacterium]